MAYSGDNLMLSDTRDADRERFNEEAALEEQEALREHYLADADTFSDWLYEQCSNTRTAPIGYVPNDAQEIDFSEKTTPRLVQYLLYPRSDVQAGAAMELQSRYLKAKGLEA